MSNATETLTVEIWNSPKADILTTYAGITVNASDVDAINARLAQFNVAIEVKPHFVVQAVIDCTYANAPDEAIAHSLSVLRSFAPYEIALAA